MCLLTNERYKTNKMGVLFGRLGHAHKVGLGVLGSKFYLPEHGHGACYIKGDNQ